jgi:hypothetical protein
MFCNPRIKAEQVGGQHDYLADHSDGSSLIKQYFCLTELVMSCSSALYPFLALYSPFYKIIPGIVFGGRTLP